MAQWFYVDKNQQRIGPMDANVLVDALRHGQLNLNSMVWQEGMPAWQPLSMHLDALGVPESMRVRKKEKSGCAIWAIVLVVVAVLAIPVLGILIAIALPAYDDFTVRTKLAGAVNEAAAAKLVVSEHLLQHSECPNNNVAGSQLATPESYASASVQRIDFGALENGNCAIEVTVPDTLAPGRVSGSVIFELSDPKTQQWRCYSESIQSKYLPVSCRSGMQ
jgi:type IV pilus assembly protein PilA